MSRLFTALRALSRGSAYPPCAPGGRFFGGSCAALAAPLPPPRAGAKRPGPRDPLFKDVWRRFQLRVHPDLFTAYPKLQAANAASLQKLQGVLNESRTAERRPEDVLKPRTESLEFYLRPAAPPRDGAPPTFVRVPFTLRVPGGRCQHSLAESLGALFGYAGLPTVFRWGPEYWDSTFSPGPEARG
jgi:hypothetical protein